MYVGVFHLDRNTSVKISVRWKSGTNLRQVPGTQKHQKQSCVYRLSNYDGWMMDRWMMDKWMMMDDDGQMMDRVTTESSDAPVDVVSQDGAAALHRWLLPGHHHIVLVGVMTAHIQGRHGNPLHLHFGIWSHKTHTHTHSEWVVQFLYQAQLHYVLSLHFLTYSCLYSTVCEAALCWSMMDSFISWWHKTNSEDSLCV